MLRAVPPAPTHLAVRSEADFRVYEVHLKAPRSPCQCVCIFVSVTVKQKGTAQLSLTLNYFLTPNYLLAVPSVSDSTARMTLTEKKKIPMHTSTDLGLQWSESNHTRSVWTSELTSTATVEACTEKRKWGRQAGTGKKNKSTVDSLMAYRQKCCVMFMAQLQSEF